MSVEKSLIERSGNVCELCTNTMGLSVYKLVGSSVSSAPKFVEGHRDLPGSIEETVYICTTCSSQIEDGDTTDPNHWRCLNDSMWSEVNAVKVVSFGMLSRLKNEGWASDLLDMIYMDEETEVRAKAFAEKIGAGEVDEDAVIHKDSNGVILSNGDNVVLIQDLKVKGGGFTAKRGTAVRRISLVWDNPEHIEGRVEGQSIVILTQYVKKTV